MCYLSFSSPFIFGTSNSLCSKPNLVTSGLDDYSNNLADPSISTLIPPIHSPHNSQRGFLKFVSDNVLPGTSPCSWDKDVACRAPLPLQFVLHTLPPVLCAPAKWACFWLISVLSSLLPQGLCSGSTPLPGFPCSFLHLVALRQLSVLNLSYFFRDTFPDSLD